MNVQDFAIVALTLPDGRLALQRRTQDAPYAPGKLGLFGGWVEDGETPDECIKREVEEETSLKVSNLAFVAAGQFTLPASSAFPKDRRYFLYKAAIENADFDVYEGDGAEIYTLEEAKQRDDLTPSNEYAIREMIHTLP